MEEERTGVGSGQPEVRPLTLPASLFSCQSTQQVNPQLSFFQRITSWVCSQGDQQPEGSRGLGCSGWGAQMRELNPLETCPFEWRP